MPSPGDPSFDRRARAARAREAVANASEERLAELRSQQLRPASQGQAPGVPSTPARPRREARPSIDVAAIARTARAALDKHPTTWTSYAELCSATGLTRNLAGTVARQLVAELSASHVLRLRDDDGRYDVPTDGAGQGDPGDGQADADRQLEAIGVAVVAGRADPRRKLYWTGSGWGVPD